MAEAAETGSLYVDELTARRLRDAADDIRAMYRLLMRALGKDIPPSLGEAGLSELFLLAAAEGAPQ